MARTAKVQVATRSTDLQAYTGSGVLYGFSFRESAGTPAAAGFALRDGTSASADFICAINFAADEATIVWLGPQGIPFNTGIYLDVQAGELEGVLYIG